MNKYITANKRSWGLLAADHYETFKAQLLRGETTLGQTTIDELGNITGKKLIHLQCNTGADTVSLARMGATVTGVDLAPENVYYAKRLAADCGVEARFIESNVLEIADKHTETYDIVFTSEGVLGWLPDLTLWAQNVRRLLKDDGFVYVMDGHPTYLIWDEQALPELVVKYPYFIKRPDRSEWIGGYASEPKQSTHYDWMFTMGELITALAQAGLVIEWLHEFDFLYYKVSEDQVRDERGGWIFPDQRDALPYTFSLKATVR